MIVYCSLIFECLLLLIVSQNLKLNRQFHKLILIVILLSLAFVSGFRYNTGTDYKHYVDIFHWINTPGINRDYEEIGFRLLNKFVYYLGLDVQFIFIISSIFLALSLYYFITTFVKKEYWILFVFLFICSGAYFSSMNILRQYIALSFVMLSFTFLYKKKNILGTCCAVASVFFHKTTIVFILVAVLYPLFRSKYWKQFLILGYITAFALFLGGLDFITEFVTKLIPKWNGYAGSTISTNTNVSAILKMIVPNILFLLYLSIVRKEANTSLTYSKDMSVWSFFLFSSYIYCVLLIAFSGIMIYSRITEYFTIFFIYLVLSLIISQKRKQEKIMLQFCIILYYVILTLITVFIMGGYGVMPYHSVFELM